MWPTESPEKAIIHIHEHQTQLCTAAAAAHDATPRTGGPRSYRIDGFRFQVGDFLIVAGRTLRDEDRALRTAH
jgi:hypothetical protein